VNIVDETNNNNNNNNNSMDSPSFKYEQDNMVVVENRNLEMHIYHPIPTIISKTIRLEEERSERKIVCLIFL
jgi:hypothetical protein